MNSGHPTNPSRPTSTTRQVAPLQLPSAAQLTLPGSKSEANRLLIAAALSGHESTIVGASPSDDVRYLVAGLKTLGFTAKFVNEATGEVRVGPRGDSAPKRGDLFCGNAGTALRFLVSVAAITEGEWTVTGDQHMQKRPIQPLVDAWRALGVDIEADDGRPPVRIRGGAQRGGRVSLDPSLSSQYLSSLLLVGANLEQGLEVTFDGPLASREYAELTCALLARLSVTATLSKDGARVANAQAKPPSKLQVGGDWSGMGVWTCLNHLTGSRITAGNLVTDSGQADEQLATTLETLAGVGDRTINVEAIPDQFLNLVIVAALRTGTTRITGAANVRVKECDRVHVMARELAKLGTNAIEHDDGLTITGGSPLHSACIDPEQDHRVAMAFALAGLVTAGITIEQPECVAKSYPTFWRDLELVRQQHSTVAIVGMRAAGKSTFGKALAQHLGSAFVDTDERFVAEHGDIEAFVAQRGWLEFRQHEEQIVADSLTARGIVATGGGAIESPATRALLRKEATVLWLRADESLLRQRLASGPTRPSLTGEPIQLELAEVLRRRTPQFADVADQVLEASQPIADLVSIVCGATRPAT